MNNDLTSWDNYSDIYSEDDEDIYSTNRVNDTTKLLLLKKYQNYVKDLINVINNIFTKSIRKLN
jgi:hypothetical protein